ncbi:hypothetical protein [Flexivirga alba]|uniref:DUF5666 domain-containing protein n=1 Tax=Flexivirga alba TaxID=702742 RepID=A0ABW2ADG6_9MICO
MNNEDAGRTSPIRRFFSRRRNIALVAAAAVIVVGGGTGIAVAAGSGSQSTAVSSPSASSSSGHFPAAGSGSNARSTNEPGGTSGVVSGTSSSGFTVTTPVGAQITVNTTSATTYRDATNGSATTTSATAIKSGAGVLVLGTVNGKAIAATQVTVEPAGSSYTTAAPEVAAMQPGQQNTSKSYGTIPSYTEGQGTIVDAQTADKAVATALAKYPGGIVDRVVKLVSGDYEVHSIGTNMHHIFEDSSFTVIGAN